MEPKLSDLIEDLKNLQPLGKHGIAKIFETAGEFKGQIRTVSTIGIKPLDGETFERLKPRFEEVLRKIQALEHPAVARCMGGWFTEQGPLFLWQQIIGSPLTKRLGDKGLEAKVPTLEVIEKIGSALAALRESGLSTAVSPENIYVTDTDEVTLFPFDLARTFLKNHVSTDQTDLFELSYASPEQLLMGYLVPPSDVFSLAILAHQILSGRLPFVVRPPGRIDAKIINEPPKITPHSDPEVQKFWKAVIRQALQKNPNHRFNDIPVFLKALGEICGMDGFDKGFSYPKEPEPSLNTPSLKNSDGTLVFDEEMQAMIVDQIKGEAAPKEAEHAPKGTSDEAQSPPEPTASAKKASPSEMQDNLEATDASVQASEPEEVAKETPNTPTDTAEGTPAGSQAADRAEDDLFTPFDPSILSEAPPHGDAAPQIQSNNSQGQKSDGESPAQPGQTPREETEALAAYSEEPEALTPNRGAPPVATETPAATGEETPANTLSSANETPTVKVRDQKRALDEAPTLKLRDQKTEQDQTSEPSPSSTTEPSKTEKAATKTSKWPLAVGLTVAALLVAGALLLPKSEPAQPEPPPAPAVTFQDAAMGNLLTKAFDADKNGVLNEEEINRITHLTMPADSGIVSFDDLSLLPNLSQITLDDLNLDNLPKLPATLTELSLANNQLSGTLDFSELPGLQQLVLAGNGLTVFPILPPSLQRLDLRENLLGEDNCPDLKNFAGTLQYNPQAQGNTVDCNNPPVTTIEIPDHALKQALLQAADQDGDGAVSQQEALRVTTLNLGGKPKKRGSVSDLTGLAAFRNLAELDVSYQKLKALNELPPRLQVLICTGNQLSDLPISQLQTLKQLRLSDNRFKQLNIGPLRNLEVLICSLNPLEAWPAFPTKLKRLFASDVRLNQPPDLSSLPELRVAVLKFNDLETLPAVGPALKTLDIQGNQLTTANCETIWAYEQHIVAFTYSDQRGTHLDCANEQAVAIPDTAFLAYLIAAHDGNGDGRFSQKEAMVVTKIKTPGKGAIRDLTGLAAMSALTELDARKESLAELPELPPALDTLYLDQNQFTDLPKKMPLRIKVLSFEGNQLSEEDCPALQRFITRHSRAKITYLDQQEAFLTDCLLTPVPETPPSVQTYGEMLPQLLDDSQVSEHQLVDYLSQGATRVPPESFTAVLTKAEKKFPGQATVQAALAKQQLLKGQPKQAVARYRKALSDINVPRGHLLFAAYAAVQADNTKQAAEWYQQEAKQRRKFALKDVFVRNGWVAGTGGGFGLSRNLTRKIKNHLEEVAATKSLTARIALLRLSFLSGDWQGFKKDLAKLKQEKLALDDWRVVVAWDLVETGAFQEAFYLLEDNPNTEAAMLRGYLHLVSYQYDQAIPILRGLDSTEFPEVNCFPALSAR
ncbi:protein kinase domain-containing protein [Acanthopleuribacter pedis]|uniref:Protein kinase n=1 Tax=Acanthopleuribacter pedis TaxID=442870 RepID=A0A8J7U4J5_9BACT|nr:protein kinase [Acanthopleuribacter pedis]MBO1318366.1 protein kinase [Acanthopleuribacter pedis]